MRTKKGRQQKKFLHSSPYKRKAPFCSSISSSERREREKSLIAPFLSSSSSSSSSSSTATAVGTLRSSNPLDLTYTRKKRGATSCEKCIDFPNLCTRSNCQYERESSHESLPPSYLGQSEGMTNPVLGGRIRSLSLFRLCLSCLDAKCVWPTHRTRGRRLLGTGLGGRQDICQILDDLCFTFLHVDISSKNIGE